MEAYAEVLNFAIPFFVLLILIEWLWSYKKGIEINRSFDMTSSLSSGITNILKDVLGLTIIIVSYGWMESKIGLFDIKSTFLLYVLAFIGKDFASYWSHRFEHVINIFWNRHIIHHSSEEFNLACALRQPISGIFGVFFFLYIPLALIGVPQEVIAVTAPLHLFAQFWYHTRLINKMGFLENIIVTPSHHRVHHAINPEYIDKNYSAIFIVWDKWFGTFQEELVDVPPVYGVKKASNTWNPIIINFQHLWLLIKDAWYTKSWKDKLRIWFMPTGWRPEDVQLTHPIEIIEDVYNQEKYDTEATIGVKVWASAQLIINVLLILYLFNNIASFEFSAVLLYGAFLFLSIFSYTTLMDGSKISIFTEALKVLFGLSLFYWMGGWYNINQLIPSGNYLFLFYLFLSFALGFYFITSGSVKRSQVSVFSI